MVVERLDLLNSNENVIKIKLCGDGTLVGRTRKLVNFAFTVINETDRAKSATGTYTIGIFEVNNENYHALEKFIPVAALSLEHFDKITIKNKEFKIEKFFSGDLKFINIVRGLKSCSSSHPCPFCSTHVREFALNSDNLASQNPRTILTNINKHDELLGYKHIPILSWIESNHYIPDILHLYLRITDVLQNLLLKEIHKLDKSNSNKITSRPNLFKYIKFLQKKCKINKPYYIDKTGNLCVRQFTGDEKKRIFDKIRISKLFPNMSDSKKIEEIWLSFNEIQIYLYILYFVYILILVDFVQ